MTQDPLQQGIESMLPEASDAATSWLQTIGDVAAIGAAIGAVVVGVSGWFLRFWHTTIKPARAEFARQRTLRSSLVCSDRTAKLIQEWVRANNAMRALLLCAENCNFQQPAKPYRVSVTIEAAQDGLPSVMDRWDQWQADSWYRQLLARIHAAYESDTDSPAVLLVTSEMEPGSANVLRDYYRETGVVASVVFFFKLTRRYEFLYVSINFGEPRKVETSESGEIRTLPHTPETEAIHLARARELFDSPERVRRKARRLQTLWAEY